MTILATAFGLGHECFGRKGVLRGTGTFPERGATMSRVMAAINWARMVAEPEVVIPPV